MFRQRKRRQEVKLRDDEGEERVLGSRKLRKEEMMDETVRAVTQNLTEGRIETVKKIKFV